MIRTRLPRRSVVFGGLFLVACCASGLRAQDVSVSPVQWANPVDPPDEIPALQGNPKLPFPDELRATPDLGYVVVNMLLDPKAKRLGGPRAATTPAYERVFEREFDRFRFSPAKRDGKPVYSSVTFALLFNPASAAPNLPDATPRLLEVALVPLPPPRGLKPSDTIPDQVVWADIAVDVEGRIAELKNLPAAHEQRIRVAAKNWRFAPARRAGQPVAAGLRVPFILATRSAESGKGERIAPRVVFQARPQYPFEMRASRMRGEVVVDFIVDIEGRVRNPFVVRSLNASFDDPAIEAVRKWKFEPGRLGERPVMTHMQVPIVFQLDNTHDGGGDGMELTKKADLSKLPEELRYDTPPKLLGAARAVFPFPLLQSHKEGRAMVTYLLDERGHVMSAKATEASAPEFGAALLAAVEQFVYQPAVKAGRPSKAVLSYRQEFSTDDRYQLVTPEDFALLRREQKKPDSIATLRELDAPPKPLSQRPPKFPLGLADQPAGEAMIEFIIDEEGRARLPRIVSASHDAFGYAAVQAIATWRFEPPTRGGKPVPARARIPVKFDQSLTRAGAAPSSR